MDPLLIVESYGGALALGAVVFCTAKLVSRRFDRKHPHLSRPGMRALARARRSRTSLDVPMVRQPFMPPGRAQIVEADEIAVEQSIDHLGRNVASDLSRRRANEQTAA